MHPENPPRENYLWERQPKENSKAYNAFCIYRDLGPDRSISKAFAEFRTGSADQMYLLKGDRSSSRWFLWSKRWNWVARSEAYDDHCDRQSRTLAEREYQDMLRRRRQQAVINQGILERARDLVDERLQGAKALPQIDATSIKRNDAGDIIQENKIKGVDGSHIRHLHSALIAACCSVEHGPIKVSQSIKLETAKPGEEPVTDLNPMEINFVLSKNPADEAD